MNDPFWFRDDLERILRSLYFTMKVSSKINRTPPDRWKGSLISFSSMAKAWNIDPATIMSASDIKIIKEMENG